MAENKYTNRPNLLRIAKELAKFKAPFKAADTLLRVVESGAKDSANTE